MGVAHWDAVEGARREAGDIAGTWRDLGEAAGTLGVGLRRIEVDPGCRSTPVHRHGAEEEFFVVLSGSGLSWQDGRTYALARGDVLLHRREAEAHTVVAGEEGIDVLAFGLRSYEEISHLPRAGVAWAGPTWVDAGGPHPFEREAAVGPLELPTPDGERPPTIARMDEIPVGRRAHGEHAFDQRNVGTALGSEVSGLRQHTIDAGRRGPPLHLHSAEEELFVVLDGEGTLELGDERIPVGAGHVVSRRPGSGVGHAFLAGDAGPLTVLAFGTRDPNDMCFYPRSNKVAFRGLGLMCRIEGGLDYWDGEP